MTEQEFALELNKLGLNLTEEKASSLNKFYEILIDKNQYMNLTRITTKEDVYLKHFYDSLTLFKALDLSKFQTLCDIGSGAGFPGIVLKIFFPNLDITLIDARQKRVDYLNEVIKKLDLKKIKAYHIRAEDLIKKQAKFDIVTARAVASLPKLLNWTMPLVKPSGYFLAMKGNVETELKEALPLFKKYQYHLDDEITFNLPIEQSQRTILKISKY